MIKLLKLNRSFLFFILVLGGVFFLLRLPNLTLQPIFADEAIYVRWAQVMKSEPTLRFLPLTDGKTPLYMWILMPMFKIFDDPLWAGRFLSIMSGFVTVIGAVVLSLKFFNHRVALWSALLISVVPFMVFFDRMALVDSMLASFTIWSLFLALWLSQSPRLDLSMILGFVLGGGMLTKTPGFFNLFVLPVTLLAYYQEKRDNSAADYRKPSQTSRLFRFLGFLMLSLLISLVIYNLLRLGPGFSSLSSRNGDYIHPLTRLLEYPLDPFMPHLRDLYDWFPKLLTWPVILAILGGVVIAIKKREKVLLTLILWSLGPLIVEMLLLKTFTARYILFTIPVLLVIAAYFIDYFLANIRVKIPRVLAYIMAVVFLITASLMFDYKLLVAPETAPLPRVEREGYFEMWTAGYGLKEMAAFLSEQAKSQRVVVGTEGYFGTLPDGLFIYLDKEPNISIVPGPPLITSDLQSAAILHPTFFVTDQSRFATPTQGLEKVMEFPKAESSDGRLKDAMILYRVLPIEDAAYSANLKK